MPRAAAVFNGLLLLVAVVLTGAGFSRPQEGQPTQRPFRSRSDLVVLHVSVIDRKAGPVAGLAREAFTVYEDGRPQPIAFFNPEDSPATVGLVIDSSLSMLRQRDAVIAAGLVFAESTNPRDEIFTVHFNENVWFGLPPGQPFTSDRDQLRTALQRSTARGRSAVFDAIAEALKHVEKGTSQKKALIVVSDGGDNSSRRAFGDVLAAAQRSEAIIYTVCLTDEYDREANPDALEQLSKASGGVAFRPDDVSEVSDVLRRIARDLHSGYTIGYVPSRAADPAFRNVRVDVATPNNRKLIVRSRSGYATD